MTQDQCSDNGHQAASSSHSAKNKTSDDPNNSNNSIFKSGINTAQEFNVDVNSKRIDQQSADVVIVRNFGLDTDRSSTDKVLTTTENSLGLISNFAGSNLNIVLNANKNSLPTKMTVITHQSSDENIREIILHPDDLNKIPNDSQATIEANLINEQSYNKPISKDKNTPKSKSDVSSNSETDKPEDPIERLNKLRASISSALSEVKGVLKQYSTEQSVDDESESSQSSKPADDGPVRFRFVRKIRRRSVFSEEIEDVTSPKSIVGEGVTLDTLSTYKPVEESSIEKAIIKSGNGGTIFSHEDAEKLCTSYVKEDNKDIKSINNNVNVAVLSVLDNEKKVNDMIPIDNEENLNKINFLKTESLQTNFTTENNEKDNSSDVASKKMKMFNDSVNTNNIQNPLSATTKTTKSKKTIKKDRRASATLDKTPPQLDLKVQRRPSDSGTILKHQTRTNSKICEKPKPTSQEISRIKPINKAETSVINNLQDTPNQVSELQKVDTISTEDTCSKSNEGIKIQACNITESSIQKMNRVNDTLDVTDVLEPNTREESNSETKEEVSETYNTSVQTEQNTEVIYDVKANIQEDLSAEKDQDYNPSNSVEDKPEAIGNTTPIIEEEAKPVIEQAPVKNRKKAKRKVVIRRIKRKLSKDDTFIQVQETPSELEIEEKEIEEQDDNDDVPEETEVAPKQRKPCIKARQFEIGDIVMYAERYKKTQVKWRKAKIVERITSISYKLDIDGEEKPAHISYIKKFTDRKVNFGGKEYLEIDYAQIEEDEEKERNYSIWNLA